MVAVTGHIVSSSAGIRREVISVLGAKVLHKASSRLEGGLTLMQGSCRAIGQIEYMI